MWFAVLLIVMGLLNAALAILDAAWFRNWGSNQWLYGFHHGFAKTFHIVVGLAMALFGLGGVFDVIDFSSDGWLFRKGEG